MAIYGEQVELPFIIVPFSAAITFDFNAGAHQACLLTGNTTVTFTNVKDGARYMVAFQQDGVGSRLVTWPAAAHFRGTDAILSTAPGAIDIFEGVVRSGIGYLWAFKGFS